ncbi:MAG: (2Fe-2S)-binding protein [Sarcina sp.]
MSIICTCKNINREEIVGAIKAGANTLESLRKALGVTTGHCNGKHCEKEILELLKTYS